jgi:Spy/CpxP family protein refolding chaperone
MHKTHFRFAKSRFTKREEHRSMKLGTRFTYASRTLLMAGLLTVACAALGAQTDAPPQGQSGPMGHRGFNPERQLQMLTHVLSLTTEQQAQVKTLLTEQSQKMEELRKTSSTADSSGQAAPPNREQMEAVHNDTDAKITALLNDDQKTKFAAWQQQRKERMEHRESGPPPPPPGE